MASTATFDRSDPGVDELVAGWKDGSDYWVRARVKQVSNTPNVGNYEILSIEPEETEEAEEEPPKKAPKRGMMPESEY